MAVICVQDADFDVIVVGAGPCGAAAAKRLVEGGASVIIVEKENLPRFKMCGGLLSPEAQELVRQHFGEVPQHVRSRPYLLEGFKIFFSESNSVEFPIEMLGSKGKVMHIWRDKFDLWLALSSGARLLDNCRYISHACEGGLITVHVRDGEKERKIKTQYLVGADGGDSTVRKVLYPHFRSKLKWVAIYEEWYEGVCDLDPNWYYSFLISAKEGYWGGLGYHDELIQLGISAKKGHDIKAAFREFRDFMKARHGFTGDKAVRTAGCVQNNMGASGQFVFGNANVLLAGEAAGLLNMASEGISPALASGHIAGDAILESMRGNINAIDAYLPRIEVEKHKTIESHKLAKSFFKTGNT